MGWVGVMEKRKRTGRFHISRMTAIYLIFAMSVLIAVYAGLSFSNSDSCVALEKVASVIYGLEGNRNTKSDSPALLGALNNLELNLIDKLPTELYRHSDFALYYQTKLVGTMLFWHGANMHEWYVVIDDDERGDCGLYSIDNLSLHRVFDALKDID